MRLFVVVCLFLLWGFCGGVLGWWWYWKFCAGFVGFFVCLYVVFVWGGGVFVVVVVVRKHVQFCIVCDSSKY